MSNVAQAIEIKINVYRAGGEWYAARWIDGEYDGSDALECNADASDAEALACAESMPLTISGQRVVRRVDDEPSN